MLFAQALDNLAEEDRRSVFYLLNEFAEESSINQQVVQNLYGESRLEQADWAQLVEIFLTPSGRSLDSRIREFCCARIQVGGSAEIIRDWTFARVVTLEQLCRHLVKLRYFNDDKEARASIEPIIGLPPSDLIDWDGRKLGFYQFWSTFDSTGARPLGAMLPPLDLVLCTLGLTMNGSGTFLLLEFKLPDSIDAHTPTFCDAYSGDFWSRYFRPAPPGARWGRTMTTDACPDKRGMPEVVHNPITMNNLCFPLRYV